VFSFALYFLIYRVFLLFGSDELCLHREGAVLAHRIHENEKTLEAEKNSPTCAQKTGKKRAATLNLRPI
jgi:hypothetical protein